MIFYPLSLAGAFVVESEPAADERGSFTRTFCAREFADHGLNACVAQCNLSHNRRTGTLRGMHMQRAPHEEAKLVRVTQGAIYDVIIDLRAGSPTYKQWAAVELRAEQPRALYVPEGFAHGFQTLVDETAVLYQMSEFHAPESAYGVRWNDPAFGIRWPFPEAPILAPRDAAFADFEA